jgi:hypothetical protein
MSHTFCFISSLAALHVPQCSTTYTSSILCPYAAELITHAHADRMPRISGRGLKFHDVNNRYLGSSVIGFEVTRWTIWTGTCFKRVHRLATG